MRVEDVGGVGVAGRADGLAVLEPGVGGGGDALVVVALESDHGAGHCGAGDLAGRGVGGHQDFEGDVGLPEADRVKRSADLTAIFPGVVLSHALQRHRRSIDRGPALERTSEVSIEVNERHILAPLFPLDARVLVPLCAEHAGQHRV